MPCVSVVRILRVRLATQPKFRYGHYELAAASESVNYNKFIYFNCFMLKTLLIKL